jgi:hypothetical protein
VIGVTLRCDQLHMNVAQPFMRSDAAGAAQFAGVFANGAGLRFLDKATRMKYKPSEEGGHTRREKLVRLAGIGCINRPIPKAKAAPASRDNFPEMAPIAKAALTTKRRHP